MLAFSNDPEPVPLATACPAATPSGADAEALGSALRRAASTISRQAPSWGDSPFVLGDLADRAPRARPAGVDEFLAAVCDYVRALRGDGTTPEQVVIAVKRHLQVAFGPYADPRRINAWLAHAVTWGIEEYYRDD